MSTMINNQHRKFWDAGYKIFGLHSIKKNGSCNCGNSDCQAIGKHPIINKWQCIPHWSEDQIYVGEEIGQYSSGYGVLCSGLLVVDIDARNGGVESYAKLYEYIPTIACAGLIVATGSGGGSKHLYFSLPTGVSLSKSLPDYPGIDFKSSGYVVGPGSTHKSGSRYEILVGSVDDITECPSELIALLKKPEFTRAEVNGDELDIDIPEVLAYLSASCDYETWLKVGMAIHHATNGTGVDLWDKWSATGDNYCGSEMIDRKWHSFGKSGTPVTIATIIRMAQDNGWCKPISDTYDEICMVDDPLSLPVDIDHCDILKPPGFVGRIAEWINQCSLYPRKRLAVITALTAIGNVGGLKYRDDINGFTPNLLSICLAGSATGKESVLTCFGEMMQSAGLSPCMAGAIKSDVEIVRNLIEHQAVFYINDELGEMLKKIANAQKRGGAVYLEGITKALMEIYTKATTWLGISGDVRRELIKALKSEYAALQKTIDENEDKSGAASSRADSILQFIDLIKKTGGIPRPFLSLIGYSTIETIEGTFNAEQAKNGFLNRTIIVEESDTNPKPNKHHNKVTFPYQDDLINIMCTGSTDGGYGRIEYYGEPHLIKTEDNAKTALRALFDWQWHYAEHHRITTGYEALARRFYEFVSKISLIMAIADGGVRTLHHVEWAAAYIKHDIDKKINLVIYASGKEHGASKDEVFESLYSRCIYLLEETEGEGEYESKIIDRLKRKGLDKKRLKEFIDKLEKSGIVKRSGKKVFKV